MPSAEHREGQGQPRPWDLVGKGGEDTWPSRLRPELTVGAEQPCPRSGGWECTVRGVGRGLSAEGQGGRQARSARPPGRRHTQASGLSHTHPNQATGKSPSQAAPNPGSGLGKRGS